MNKFLTLTIFLSVFFSFSQDKPQDSSSVSSTIYVGFGGQRQSGLRLNQKLVQSNLPTVPNILPEIIFGLNVFGKKYSGELEFSGVILEGDRGPNRIELETSNFRGNFSYNLMNRPKIAFTTGLDLAYTYTAFDVFDKQAAVDLNNLNPAATPGHIQLYQNRFYAGPSDRKSTRLNSSHLDLSRMPSSA